MYAISCLFIGFHISVVLCKMIEWCHMSKSWSRARTDYRIVHVFNRLFTVLTNSSSLWILSSLWSSDSSKSDHNFIKNRISWSVFRSAKYELWFISESGFFYRFNVKWRLFIGSFQVSSSWFHSSWSFSQFQHCCPDFSTMGCHKADLKVDLVIGA